uniref:Uma2 family endonuclease n=1 Tax=Desertifilum tharense IPPAS B-1220 TaxID=1781255 RepID=A0ACD5H4K1_9CYAN
MDTSSEERHEYHNGLIISMSGATPNHNQIAGNFYAVLNFALKHQPYRVFINEPRLWIPRKRVYTYPDVMVVQDELQLQEERQDTLMNPMLVVEVMSGTTRSYDKDAKFTAYRTIPSFQEYILIDQYTMHIEQYFRTEQRRWAFLEYDNSDDVISLNSLSLQVGLMDIYEKVDLDRI